MKIALAQINPIVGDIRGNQKKIKRLIEQAYAESADMIVFPELALWGYPPRDLLEFEDLLRLSDRALVDLAREAPSEMVVVLGTVVQTHTEPQKPLNNVAAWLEGGKIKHIVSKRLLPTYDVFDETRYFTPGLTSTVIDFRGKKIGLTICEDIWNGYLDSPRYAQDPVVDLVTQGVEVIINLSASPFSLKKFQSRLSLLQSLTERQKVDVVYVNQVGGQDELVFDGGSMVVGERGQLLHAAPFFKESLTYFSFGAAKPMPIEAPDDAELLEKALVLGLKDYTRKCGFKKVALGLSGGIDSAVTAVLAVKALGRKNVLGLIMPSRYSSAHSQRDAVKLAQNLGIQIKKVPIDLLQKAYEKSFLNIWGRTQGDTTEENIQARIRGNLLMALSNKKGHMILSTGNKSELAVGYCTLYGDMSGGLAVISDVPKMMIYELARFMNRKKEWIPDSSLTKPPSAELRPNQTDQDSLPSYEVLDAILKARIEERKGEADIVALGFPRDVVRKILNLIQKNEYKRRQAAPGLRVTSKAFGIGRRMPIACKF